MGCFRTAKYTCTSSDPCSVSGVASNEGVATSVALHRNDSRHNDASLFFSVLLSLTVCEKEHRDYWDFADQRDEDLSDASDTAFLATFWPSRSLPFVTMNLGLAQWRLVSRGLQRCTS